MTEYIEREKAQDGLDNIDWYHVNDKGQLLPSGKTDIETYVPFKAVEEMLKSIPAADVRPVVRAVWRRYSPFTDTYECSNCGEQVIDQQFRTNYCPNCGAKMEES